jgi:hypothetical protein
MNDDITRSRFNRHQVRQNEPASHSKSAGRDAVESDVSKTEDASLRSAVQRTRRLSDKARVQDARARVSRITAANRRRHKSDQ